MDDAEVGFIAAQTYIARFAIRRELVLLLEGEQLFVKLDRARHVAGVDDRKTLSAWVLNLTDVKLPRAASSSPTLWAEAHGGRTELLKRIPRPSIPYVSDIICYS